MGEKKVHSWYLRERIGLLKLKARDKAVLSALAGHYPKVYTSQIRVAELSGFSRRTVQRAIESLLEAGYLRRTRRVGVTNLYEIDADLILMRAVQEEAKLPAVREKAKTEHRERVEQVRRKKRMRLCMPQHQESGHPAHGELGRRTDPRHGDAGLIPEARHGGTGNLRHGDALNIPDGTSGMFNERFDNHEEEASSRVDSDESTPTCKDEDDDRTIMSRVESSSTPPHAAARVSTPLPKSGAPPLTAAVSKDHTDTRCDLIKSGREGMYNTKNLDGTCTCIACHQQFPADQFPPSHSHPDRPGLWCANCRPAHLDAQPESAAKLTLKKQAPKLPGGYTIEAYPKNWESVEKAPVSYIVWNADRTLSWVGRTKWEAIDSALRNPGHPNSFAPRKEPASQAITPPRAPTPQPAPPTCDGLPDHIIVRKSDGPPSFLFRWSVYDTKKGTLVGKRPTKEEATAFARDYIARAEREGPKGA
jgi:DNA-binding transcriptional ArsR family regulator